MRTARLSRAALFALAATIIAVSLGVLGSNTNARFDLTLSGEHALGERTLARLRTLDRPVELVVAVNRGRLDRRARDRVDDVLAALDHASTNLDITFIDVGSPQGSALYDDLVRRLERREAPRRERIFTSAEVIREGAIGLSASLSALGTAADSAAKSDAVHNQRLREFAAFARVAARQLNDINKTELSIRDLSPARDVTGFAAQLAPQLEVLAGELGAMENGAPSEEARLRVRNAARVADETRGRAAVLAEAGARLGQTDLDRVAGALESGEAALLIGPPRDSGPGLVAIDLRELYPPPELFALAGHAAEIATSDRAEQLFGSALAVLADPARPIVVFVHGESGRWIGKAGAMTGLLERLTHSGIDHAEWAAVIEPDPPNLVEIDPSGDRPVVYCVISPDSAAGANPKNPQAKPGTERALRVSEVVALLIARGEPVMVNLNPSVFPTFGDKDPIAAALAPFGVSARSGMPLLTTEAQMPVPTQRMATPGFRVVPGASDHPVGSAIAGLPLALTWPIPLGVTGDAVPLLIADASEKRWAETQWLRLWRTPSNQRHLLADQPTFNADQGDSRGPWTIAAAARGPETGGRRARAVVVGSNRWFLDQTWSMRETVNGRPLLINPGNVELFDAAVLWLAGRDELIAPGPSARPIALIRPISRGTLAAIRWALIGGLPLLILLAGVMHRAVRG